MPSLHTELGEPVPQLAPLAGFCLDAFPVTARSKQKVKGFKSHIPLVLPLPRAHSQPHTDSSLASLRPGVAILGGNSACALSPGATPRARTHPAGEVFLPSRSLPRGAKREENRRQSTVNPLSNGNPDDFPFCACLELFSFFYNICAFLLNT